MSKPKCNEGMPFTYFTELYEGLVLSIINDGSAACTSTNDVVATSLNSYTYVPFIPFD